MIFGEIVALLAPLGASGFGISALVAYAKKSDLEQARKQTRSDKRQLELSDGEKKQILIRRDELYVEANP